jgi:glycine betaine/proline transport system substrate-binding protein
MLDQNAFDLKSFRLVESSEAGMMSQVKRSVNREQWIAFLGWAPHPMNSNFDMVYLDGGDDFFGPNYGGASVHTNVRQGYLETCSNVGQLLQNLSFSLEMESQLMGNILDDKAKPDAAAKTWLKANPQVLEQWLDKVTARDGSNATEAVKTYLNI